MIPLTIVGLNYKTAPVEIRERFAFGLTEIPPMVVALHAIPGIEECLLLSTCNRTETYLVTPADPPVAQVLDFLKTSRAIPPAGAVVPPVYVHRGTAAARHTLRVTAGLDSMVLGEGQILGQMRRAFDIARAAQTTGPVLNRLMQLAIATGRRVRRETGLSRGAPSVPRAALALCQQVLGSVLGRRVVVVGAGDMAALVVKEFAAAGMKVVAVANRTLETARSLAAWVSAKAISLDALPTALGPADIIVACAAATEPLLSSKLLVAAGHRCEPLLVIDLGIPRSVDAAVSSLHGVVLYDLDDLLPRAFSPTSAEDLAAAERIVEDALAVFERWMASRAAGPLLRALHSRMETIVDGELVRSRARLRALSEGQREAVRGVVEAAMKKLLHIPIVRLREAASRRDINILESARKLFDLDVGKQGPRGPQDDTSVAGDEHA